MQITCKSGRGNAGSLSWLSSAGSEHLPYKQRVGGSNPSTPTRSRKLRDFFMITVYVIRSIPTGRLYVGQTKDFNNRLKEHNLKKPKYTSSYAPWNLVYKEETADRTQARIREKYLKSTSGKNFLKRSKII